MQAGTIQTAPTARSVLVCAGDMHEGTALAMKNLQLKDITIDFGVRRCLDRVSLNFPYGQRIALSGANGSGKSHPMKIAAGIMNAAPGGGGGRRGARGV